VKQIERIVIGRRPDGWRERIDYPISSFVHGNVFRGVDWIIYHRAKLPIQETLREISWRGQ